MKGVILAGGHGTRLRPLTHVANKHLLPIYNKPMILYPLESLKTLGCTDILIVTGGEYVGRFAEFLKDGKEFGVNITYKVQTEANGIAHALALAEQFAEGEDIAVILGDNIFDNNVLKENEFHKEMAHIYTKEVKDPERFGVVVFNGREPFTIIEKPTEEVGNRAVVGLYHYPSDVFDVIRTLEPSARGEYEITDVNNHYLKEDNLCVFEFDGFWSDAGTFPSLLRASNWVASYE